MLPAMDWQQIGALLIVCLTALAFARGAWRKRRDAGRQAGCGCTATGASERPPETVLRARKGERPRLTVKLK